MNTLDLFYTYKEHRKHYIALKHLVDAQVREALAISDEGGTKLALDYENTYHLSDLRKKMHELYKRVRIDRQLNVNICGYDYYNDWGGDEVE